MSISTKDGLTDRQAAQFFAAPESTPQRQYEALRAYFVEKLPSAEVARRFGYSPGAFRVLCHQFRNDADKRQAFFAVARSGPDHAPVRDLVRERAVTLRKQSITRFIVGVCGLRKMATTVSYGLLAVLQGGKSWLVVARKVRMSRPWC